MDPIYEIELQDCPYCRGTGTVEDEQGWCVYVTCVDCGAQTAHASYESPEERLAAAPVERRQGSEPRRRRLIRLELHKKDGRKASSVLFALNRRLSARNSPSIARFPAIGYTELIKDVRTL